MRRVLGQRNDQVGAGGGVGDVLDDDRQRAVGYVGVDATVLRAAVVLNAELDARRAGKVRAGGNKGQRRDVGDGNDLIQGDVGGAQLQRTDGGGGQLGDLNARESV